MRSGQRREGRGDSGDPPAPLRRSLPTSVASSMRRSINCAPRRATSLLDERKVGRAGLPATVLGLLFHAAEHTTRHVGQAITTASGATSLTIGFRNRFEGSFFASAIFGNNLSLHAMSIPAGTQNIHHMTTTDPRDIIANQPMSRTANGRRRHHHRAECARRVRRAVDQLRVARHRHGVGHRSRRARHRAVDGAHWHGASARSCSAAWPTRSAGDRRSWAAWSSWPSACSWRRR